MSIPMIGSILGMAASAPVGILQSIGGILNGNGAKAQAAAADRAEFSRLAQMMNTAARGGVSPSPEGLGLEGLQARQTELLAGIEAELGNLFREVGVPQDTRVTLRSNAIGGVGVANDIPQQAALESALALRPDLEQSFQQLTSVTGLLRAAEAATAAGTPGAQGIATYLDAFAPAPGRMLLSMQRGAASVQYP